MLLAGGITSLGVVQSQDQILSLEIQKDLSIVSCRVNMKDERSRHDLMLIGHAVEVIDNGDAFLVLGGGAVCFSFGTFRNRNIYLFKSSRGNDQISDSWKVVPNDPRMNALSPRAEQALPRTLNPSDTLRVISVPRVPRLKTHEEFQALVDARKPVVLQELPLGNCVRTWTYDYLKATVGATTEVSLE